MDGLFTWKTMRIANIINAISLKKPTGFWRHLVFIYGIIVRNGWINYSDGSSISTSQALIIGVTKNCPAIKNFRHTLTDAIGKWWEISFLTIWKKISNNALKTLSKKHTCTIGDLHPMTINFSAIILSPFSRRQVYSAQSSCKILSLCI